MQKGDEEKYNPFCVRSVNNWENNKSRPNVEHRPIVIALIEIFFHEQVITSPAEANKWLSSAGLPKLSVPDEVRRIFGNFYGPPPINTVFEGRDTDLKKSDKN